MANKKSGFRSFFKRYVVDALSQMAMGLFCSLILGLIIGQIAKIEDDKSKNRGVR